MSTRYASAVPAYGRDYKSQKEVREAWLAGSDFLIQSFDGSGYININDKPNDMQLNIRFKRQTLVCVILSK